MPAPIDVFVVAGQSNALGRGDAVLSPPTPRGRAYAWGPGGRLNHLRDPVGRARTGSAWPTFTDTLLEHGALAVTIVPCAVGGTGLLPGTDLGHGEWSPEGDLLDVAVSRGQAAAAELAQRGWRPRVHVVWHQGERDARRFADDPDLGQRYQAALVDLYARFARGLRMPRLRVYVCRVGRRADGRFEAAYAAVREAQDRACADEDGLRMVYRGCVRFPERGFMNPDGIHYDQRGLNRMGARAGDAVAADLGYGSTG